VKSSHRGARTDRNEPSSRVLLSATAKVRLIKLRFPANPPVVKISVTRLGQVTNYEYEGFRHQRCRACTSTP
jgi:hypothetical protein